MQSWWTQMQRKIKRRAKEQIRRVKEQVNRVKYNYLIEKGNINKIYSILQIFLNLRK